MSTTIGERAVSLRKRLNASGNAMDEMGGKPRSQWWNRLEGRHGHMRTISEADPRLQTSRPITVRHALLAVALVVMCGGGAWIAHREEEATRREKAGDHDLARSLRETASRVPN